ncbi:MAG: TauD/TfdA family dioxygenase [Gammaproteobacteria bacterium]|nr:TauD/TfdA family dioxygenase [Gammaproteobacteria bacterium]
MNCVPFAGVSFGADITDVDLSAVRDSVFSAICAAWLERAVLRIRGQSLDDGGLMRFARLFGPLEYRPMGWITQEEREKAPNPYLATISNIVVDGSPIGGLGAAEAAWHTDMSYIEHPPTASILHALEVPEGGGSTHFCNMIGALQSLPPDLARRVRGARLKHDAAHDSVGTLRRGHHDVDDPRDAPGACHPMVLRHPETGIDALYLGRRQDAHVEGLPLEESEAFLDTVWRYVALEGDVWTQEWEVGDVLVWDNRSVMHRRAAFDPIARRLMRRAQVRSTNQA